MPLKRAARERGLLLVPMTADFLTGKIIFVLMWMYHRFRQNVSICRVGIVKNDSPEVPLAVVDIVDYDSEAHEPVITEENKYKGHVIDIQITGNCEYTSIDGKRVDVTMRPLPWGGEAEAPRQINPLGNNDVNTFQG